MAEEHDGVGVFPLDSEHLAVVDIAVARKQTVYAVADSLIFLGHVSAAVKRGGNPLVLVVIVVVLAQKRGCSVPRVGALPALGVYDIAVKLAQPVENFRCSSQRVERSLRGILSPSERRAVKRRDIRLCQPVLEQFRLAPTLGGQRVYRIIRVSVTNDKKFHIAPPQLSLLKLYYFRRDFSTGVNI